MALPTGVDDALTEALFTRTPQIRYLSHAGGQEMELRERPGLADASEDEALPRLRSLRARLSHKAV